MLFFQRIFYTIIFNTNFTVIETYVGQVPPQNFNGILRIEKS